jgi:23S rRNA (uracil1939-C5)-methyltransferase
MTIPVSAQYKAGDVLDVKIEKIVPGGHGLAFVEGLTLFVDLSAVGDRLRVRVREVKGGKIAFAAIEAVLEPSPLRISPPCPYVGSCGGCDFQQMSYQAQLEAKLGIIRDCLHRIGKLDYDREIPIISSPHEFGYRLRAQWHIDAARREIGYYRRDSRDLIAIEHCPILTPDLDALLQKIRGDIDWSSFWPDKGAIDAACGDEGVSVSSSALGLDPEEVSFAAEGEDFAYAADVFFQGNKFLISELIETAVGDAAGNTAFDLYSGVGLFTLPLARKFKKVVAVEELGKAVQFSTKNVTDAGLGNVEIVERSVSRFLAEREAGGVDFALLDPPRFGTEKKTVLDLIRIRPRRVSYVSCDPSVLARDLRRFLDGGYEIDSISAIDLFPQTHHVETIVKLSTDGNTPY